MVWTHPKSGRHQMALTSGGWVSPGKGNRGRRGVRRTGKEQRRFTQKNGDWETEDVNYMNKHTYVLTHIYKKHTHTHIHRNTYTYMHACIRTYVHAYMHACNRLIWSVPLNLEPAMIACRSSSERMSKSQCRT
jgi:hypothetical protein